MRAPSPDLLAAVREILRFRLGADEALTGSELVALLHEMGLPAHLRRANEAVDQLRAEGLPIVGTHHGYFIAATPGEAADFARAQRSRIARIARGLKAFDRATAEAVLGQLRIEEARS